MFENEGWKNSMLNFHHAVRSEWPSRETKSEFEGPEVPQITHEKESELVDATIDERIAIAIWNYMK